MIQLNSQQREEPMEKLFFCELQFDIYRKPSYTDRLITSDSQHDFKQKMAAFHCMVHRMVTFRLSDANYKKELKKIKQLGKVNGYK